MPRHDVFTVFRKGNIVFPADLFPVLIRILLVSFKRCFELQRDPSVSFFNDLPDDKINGGKSIIFHDVYRQIPRMMPRHSRNSRTVNGPGEFRSQGSIPEDQPVDRLFLPEIHILPQPLVAPVQKQHIVTVPCQTSVNQLEKIVGDIGHFRTAGA